MSSGADPNSSRVSRLLAVVVNEDTEPPGHPSTRNPPRRSRSLADTVLIAVRADENRSALRHPGDTGRTRDPATRATLRSGKAGQRGQQKRRCPDRPTRINRFSRYGCEYTIATVPPFIHSRPPRSRRTPRSAARTTTFVLVHDDRLGADTHALQGSRRPGRGRTAAFPARRRRAATSVDTSRRDSGWTARDRGHRIAAAEGGRRPPDHTPAAPCSNAPPDGSPLRCSIRIGIEQCELLHDHSHHEKHEAADQKPYQQFVTRSEHDPYPVVRLGMFK